MARDPAGDELEQRVRERIRSQLASGSARKGAIARELGLSPRTLDRALARRGTSFRLLVDDVRRELAERCLREGRSSLGEIARSLGYADPANFTRAFRRWAGQNPLSYRRKGGAK
jgi:AraC-like DNA-binding protein